MVMAGIIFRIAERTMTIVFILLLTSDRDHGLCNDFMHRTWIKTFTEDCVSLIQKSSKRSPVAFYNCSGRRPRSLLSIFCFFILTLQGAWQEAITEDISMDELLHRQTTLIHVCEHTKNHLHK